jgi:hypothetical protein
MAYVLKDRCMNSTTTTGTSTLTLGSAVAGFQSISVIGDGNLATFCAYAVDANGVPNGGWEVFVGAYASSGTTLTRAKVLSSSNGGSAVNWGAGTKYVALVVDDVSRSLAHVGLCQGRLTLTSGVPVTTSDVTAATSVYWTPFNGNRISLYNGSAWEIHAFAELSLSTTGLTANKPYDVFAYINAGAVAIEALGWTDGTTRATAITYQDGVAVKSGDATRRLLGTFYTFDDAGTTKTCDTAGGLGSGGVEAKRFVSNKYNRVPRPCFVGDTSDSWSYNSAAWRAANNSNTNRISFVQTDAEYPVLVANNQNIGAAGNAIVGIGIDSTSAFSGASGWWNGTSVGSALAQFHGHLSAGFHYASAIEYMVTGSATFWGDVGSGWPVQTGLVATIWG